MTDDELKSWRELRINTELYKMSALNFQAACEALDAKLRDLQEKYDRAVSDKAVAENGQQALQRALDYINAEIVTPMGLANEQLRREVRSLLAARESAQWSPFRSEGDVVGNWHFFTGNGMGFHSDGQNTLTVNVPKPQHEPAPAQSAKEPVKPFVMAALNLRMAEGALKYGTPLCLFNGRDAANDAAEEVLDAVQYLVQAQEERNVLASREGYFENGVCARLHNSRLRFSVSAERLYYRRYISATEQTTVKDLILKAGGYNIEDMHDYFFVSVGPEVNIAKFVRTVLDALRVDANANAKTD